MYSNKRQSRRNTNKFEVEETLKTIYSAKKVKRDELSQSQIIKNEIKKDTLLSPQKYGKYSPELKIKKITETPKKSFKNNLIDLCEGDDRPKEIITLLDEDLEPIEGKELIIEKYLKVVGLDYFNKFYYVQCKIINQDQTLILKRTIEEANIKFLDQALDFLETHLKFESYK